MTARRAITVNGGSLQVVEQGTGPLVVLLHGFPESSYSWRHQIDALANAGYRVIAPDQRGYGGSDRPLAVEAYDIVHLIDDVVGLIRAAGEDQAVVVGHDWGATVAWQTALLRPASVRAVVGLSVPLRPRGSRPPLQIVHDVFGGRFYWSYFQSPGVAEAELDRDPRDSLRRFLYGLSGDSPAITDFVLPAGGGLLDLFPEPEQLPGWLSDADLDQYAAAIGAAGFAGGLNYFRNLDRNWELTADVVDAYPQMPGLYLAGDRDPVLAAPGATDLVAAMVAAWPQLAAPIYLPGCGHWTQQERPVQVTNALIEFLDALPASAS